MSEGAGAARRRLSNFHRSLVNRCQHILNNCNSRYLRELYDMDFDSNALAWRIRVRAAAVNPKTKDIDQRKEFLGSRVRCVSRFAQLR